MRCVALIPLVLLLAACSTSGPRDAGYAGAQANMSEDPNQSQMQCYEVWEGILQEWVVATGGVQKSPSETRRRIKNDEKSVLSRIIVRSWGMRSAKGGDDPELIGIKFGAALDEIARDTLVPVGCRSGAWLTPLLVESPGVFAPGAREELMMVAPSETSADARAFSKWLLQMMLTPGP